MSECAKCLEDELGTCTDCHNAHNDAWQKEKDARGETDDCDSDVGGEPCRNCGGLTSQCGPFGEALHTSCWEEEDEAIDALST